jgi:hypothetical protein
MSIKYNKDLTPDEDFQVLGARGFSGAYNDRILQALGADGFNNSSINDGLLDVSLTPPVITNWILGSGIWNDNGIWVDSSVWVD